MRPAPSSVARRAALLTLPLVAIGAYGVSHGAGWHPGADLAGLIKIARTHGSAGFVGVFIFQLLIAASGVLTASLLGIVAGALFGIIGGFVVAAAGTLAGAALAFVLARSLLRPLIVRLLRHWPRLHRLDDLVAVDGWKLVCLLRISPIMPFAVTSYALGLSGVGFRAYLLGTLASLPPLLAYVLLGSMVGIGAMHLASGNLLNLGFLALGGVATVVLLLHTGRLLRRAWSQAGGDRLASDEPVG